MTKFIIHIFAMKKKINEVVMEEKSLMEDDCAILPVKTS